MDGWKVELLMSIFPNYYCFNFMFLHLFSQSWSLISIFTSTSPYHCSWCSRTFLHITLILNLKQLLLMIGDSNRVLIVVEDEVKKNEWRCGSEARRQFVASKEEKATIRGFLTEVAFLGHKLCHESWHFGDDSSLLTIMRLLLICSWVFDGYLSFLEPKYLLIRF